MVKIRLRRMGKKGQPSYRIVVAEVTSPRDGRFIETLGHYNPITEPETVKYEEARALYWLSVGAQPTDAVKRFFQRDGLYDKLSRVHAGESIDEVVGSGEEQAGTPVSPPPVNETPAAQERVDATDNAEDQELAPMTAAPVEEEMAAVQESTDPADSEDLTPAIADGTENGS